MIPIFEYVARTLHTEITRTPFDHENSLPLYLRELFNFEKWTVFGVGFIVASPRENLAAKTLAKHEAKLKSVSGLPIAFGYHESTGYRAERMVEAGIPFIVDGRQLYLPFLGVALSKGHGKRSSLHAADVDKVSAQTQRFILKVIYENLTDLSVTQTSDILSVAKITASRIYDELEVVNPTWITTDGRIRKFVCEADRAAFWRKVEPYLFNPVVREYRLDRITAIGHLPLSGISAISHYSGLADGPFPTFATTKTQEGELDLKNGKSLAGWDQWDDPACVVQVMRYCLDSMNDAAIDPLSAILSLSDEDKNDPRIEGEIRSIIKGVFDRRA